MFQSVRPRAKAKGRAPPPPALPAPAPAPAPAPRLAAAPHTRTRTRSRRSRSLPRSNPPPEFRSGSQKVPTRTANRLDHRRWRFMKGCQEQCLIYHDIVRAREILNSTHRALAKEISCRARSHTPPESTPTPAALASSQVDLRRSSWGRDGARLSQTSQHLSGDLRGEQHRGECKACRLVKLKDSRELYVTRSQNNRFKAKAREARSKRGDRARHIVLPSYQISLQA